MSAEREERAENNDSVRFPVGYPCFEWFMQFRTFIRNDRTFISPMFYSPSINPADFKMRVYFNIIKKDGSSAFETQRDDVYLKSDDCKFGVEIDLEEMLNEENGYLDDVGSLTIEYGLQVEGEKDFDDGIWRFYLNHILFDRAEKDNMLMFLSGNIYGSITYAHRHLLELHSRQFSVAKKYGVQAPESSKNYDVKACLQITQGVRFQTRKISTFAKVSIIAVYFGFSNAVRYCEQQLIESDEQQKVTIKKFEMAVECNMRCYLRHLLKHLKTRKLIKLLRKVDLEKMSSEPMKACVDKLLS